MKVQRRTAKDDNTLIETVGRLISKQIELEERIEELETKVKSLES
jgi:chaperonin cofactor prefoldin